MKIEVLALALCLIACAGAVPNLSPPVVGIVGLPVAEGCVTVTGPGDTIGSTQLHKLQAEMQRIGDSDGYNGFDGVSCFSAFYVKWLEAAGAIVMPIRHNLTKAEAEFYFSSLNGLLFTGGELDLTLTMPYVQTTKYFFDLATQSNAGAKPGDESFFPIWGTCQGFQLLNIVAAWNTSVLCNNCFEGVDNIPLPLRLTATAASSRLFSGLPAEVTHILSSENVTQNFHVSGVFPSTMENNPHLELFYDMLSTNVDKNGKAFASTMEAKNYPIYATQWHPERPQFEFVPGDDISHTYNAVAAMQVRSRSPPHTTASPDSAAQLVADFFVQQTRFSTHTFADPEKLEKSLIYNYSPMNLGHSNQVYVF